MTQSKRFAGAALIISIQIAIASCATTGGEKSRLFPESRQISEAAVTAITDPYTWAPVLGAALFGMSDLDDQVSDWAGDETPLFGSNHDARVVSDTAMAASSAAMYVTAIFVPERGEDVAEEKVKRIVIERLSAGATATATKALKEGVGRTRPDGSNTQSFPSGHSSSSFVSATLARRNLEYFEMSRGAKTVVGAGFTAIAATCAWARIEGNVHYPSDVLFGAALGNFLGVFIHDSFFDWKKSGDLQVAASPMSDGMVISVTIQY